MTTTLSSVRWLVGRKDFSLAEAAGLTVAKQKPPPFTLGNRFTSQVATVTCDTLVSFQKVSVELWIGDDWRISDRKKDDDDL